MEATCSKTSLTSRRQHHAACCLVLVWQGIRLHAWLIICIITLLDMKGNTKDDLDPAVTARFKEGKKSFKNKSLQGPKINGPSNFKQEREPSTKQQMHEGGYEVGAHPDFGPDALKV
eukprot:1158040-Pelagomonas_calceolata.AAC.5